MAVVVALHFAVADVDLGPDGDVEHAVLENLFLGVHAVGRHAEALLAQLILELIVGQAVVPLDLRDGSIDLVAADGQLELRRLLGQQLIVDESLQDFAANGVGARLAFGRVGDGRDFRHEGRCAVLDLALQNDVVPHQGDDFLHDAGLGRAGRAQQDHA